jgi:hypothetical protein
VINPMSIWNLIENRSKNEIDLVEFVASKGRNEFFIPKPRLDLTFKPTVHVKSDISFLDEYFIFNHANNH